MNYTELKKHALESVFERANDMQKQAVFRVKGALLIIAGAGSGKTSVLVDRIANIMRFGNAYHDTTEREISDEERSFLEEFPSLPKTPENIKRLADITAVEPCAPWNILAITFTNKAAAELRERLNAKIGDGAEYINASTFHSACVKILRRDIERLGYAKSFIIYDDDDTKRIFKEAMKRHNIDEKEIPLKFVRNEISHAKDKLITVQSYKETAEQSGADNLKKTAQVYEDYQMTLERANALDFDDIIMLTVRLLEENPDILEYYRDRFRYILVDEYQDTNIAQYKLVSLLAGENGNLCVVGDDDQSIYRFRGATVENILSFEKQYKGAVVIRLEQNYRSTCNILNAANAIISNNSNRKKKHLWSQLGDGEKIKINCYQNETAEAKAIADIIEEGVKNGAKYSDYAVLYRNNALSRSYETALSRLEIPYKVVGGTRFFDRKEVRDIIAYLSLLYNPNDTARFRRVINEPKRGVGDATIEEIIQISIETEVSPLEICRTSAFIPGLHKRSNSLTAAAIIFEKLSELSKTLKLDELIDAVARDSGYLDMLVGMGADGISRIENINELKSYAAIMMEENPDAGLPEFLEQVALVSDMDNYDSESDCVSLMTMHSAKGLEFPTVFLAAAEDNIFPTNMAKSDYVELEEERRLAYVAVTRAKRELYITHTHTRMLYGKTGANQLSVFAKEIPNELCDFYTEEFVHTRLAKPEHKSYLKAQAETRRIAAESAVSGEIFSVGDRVRHNLFGEGTVTAYTAMGNDAMVTIIFDVKGEKRVMRNNARMTKI